MKINDVYRLNYLEDVRISPDGRLIAYIQREAEEQNDEWHQSLYVVPTEESGEPHLLSRIGDASSIAWAPDGTRIAFVGIREADRAIVTGEDGDSVTENAPQVWAFDLARGGDPKQLTNFPQGVSEFDWGPDGDRLVVAVRERDADQREGDLHDQADVVEVEMLQHKSVGRGWVEGQSKCLYVIDTESRESTRIDEAYTDKHAASHRMQPTWGPHGREIAFLANRTESADESRAVDVYTTTPDGSDLTRLTNSGLAVTDVAWSPSGERLAFVAAESENPYALEDVIITGRAQEETKCVTSGLDYPVAADVQWRDEDTVLFPIGQKGLVRLATASIDGNTATPLLEDLDSTENLASYDVGETGLAVGIEDPERGYEVHHASRTTDSCIDAGTRLLNVNSEFDSASQLPACKRITYSSEQGVEIEGLLYHQKRSDLDGETPLVVSVHGGPASFAHPEVLFDHMYWVDNGYAVFCPNYRGSSSYGPAFMQAIRDRICTKECTDVIRGAEHLVERGIADPNHVYATGFSYGATVLSHVLAETEIFTAAAVEHGIYDYRSAFGTNDTHIWLEENLGHPWKNQEAYAEASSILKVDSVETPLLVVAGEDDWRCPPTQAEQLYVSLKKQGRETKLLIYPNVHHNAGTPRQTAHRIDSITEWFENH